MACVKGRINPDAQTKLRLFSDSAGYCQRPECRRRLFSDKNGLDYHIAEMAHIFGASDAGPRANSNLDIEDRPCYENMILLCPSCHSMVDKDPSRFTVSVLGKWKMEHKRLIEEKLGVPRYSSRDSVRKFIEPILRMNSSIFRSYNPNNNYRENPEAEEAGMWKRKMVSQIIPNNQKILVCIDANIHLVNSNEHEVLELFRQHVDDLINVHLLGEKIIATKYPCELNYILKD